MADFKIEYFQVSNEDTDHGDDDPEGRCHNDRGIRKRHSVEMAHWIAHLSSVCVLLGLLWKISISDSLSKLACIQRHSTWSPAIDLSDKISKVIFFGTFDGSNTFKGETNASTEAAWDTMWNYNIVNLTTEQMIDLGRPLDSIQYPEEYGGGYLAQVKAVHQLHCLHAIWQAQHIEQVPDLLKTKTTRPEYYKRHIQQFVDITRQRLMCTADPGLVIFRWVEGEDHAPEPDFNTPHMCQDWEKLTRWNQKHATSVEVDDIRWQAPAGVRKLPKAP